MLPLPCELHDSIRRCLVNNFLRTVIDNPCNNSFTFKVDADGYFSTISKELRLARRLHGINGFRGEAAWCALGFGQIQICRRILVWIAVDGFDFRHKLHAPKLTLRRTTVRTHGLLLPFQIRATRVSTTSLRNAPLSDRHPKYGPSPRLRLVLPHDSMQLVRPTLLMSLHLFRMLGNYSHNSANKLL